MILRAAPAAAAAPNTCVAVAHGSAAAEPHAHARQWLEENRAVLPQRLREAGVACCPACGSESLDLPANPLTIGADPSRLTLQFECGGCGHLLRFDAHKLGYLASPSASPAS